MQRKFLSPFCAKNSFLLILVPLVAPQAKIFTCLGLIHVHCLYENHLLFSWFPMTFDHSPLTIALSHLKPWGLLSLRFLMQTQFVFQSFQMAITNSPLAIGQWPLASGHWQFAFWPLAGDHSPLTIDNCPLPICQWPLAIDHWLFNIGPWFVCVCVCVCVFLGRNLALVLLMGFAQTFPQPTCVQLVASLVFFEKWCLCVWFPMKLASDNPFAFACFIGNSMFYRWSMGAILRFDCDCAIFKICPHRLMKYQHCKFRNQ